MSEVRYYFDEHIAHAIAQGLRSRGVNVLLARDAGMKDADDEVHLALATSQRRVVYTNDQDFTRLHAQGVPHAGIVFAAQGLPVGVVVEGLFEIFAVLTAEDMQNRLRFL